MNDCEFCRTTPNRGEKACISTAEARECGWMDKSDWVRWEELNCQPQDLRQCVERLRDVVTELANASQSEATSRLRQMAKSALMKNET